MSIQKFFTQIEPKVKNYFEMTEDQKDEILAEFANEYIRFKFTRGKTLQQIYHELLEDIHEMEKTNRFELAAAMTDVREGLMEVFQQLNNQHGNKEF
jgi:hypothetical protein